MTAYGRVLRVVEVLDARVPRWLVPVLYPLVYWLGFLAALIDLLYERRV